MVFLLKKQSLPLEGTYFLQGYVRPKFGNNGCTTVKSNVPLNVIMNVDSTKGTYPIARGCHNSWVGNSRARYVDVTTVPRTASAPMALSVETSRA